MGLRDYQRNMINAINKSLVEDGKALAVAATGAGKSRVFSEFVKYWNITKKVKFLIVVNKIKLVEQAVNNLELVGAEATIFNASLNKKEISQITVGSIQSLINYDGHLEFDCIIFDEAHAFDLDNKDSNSYKLYLKCNKPKVIGFTATPFTNNRIIYGKNKFFKEICDKVTINDLTPDYLVPLKVRGIKKVNEIDVSKVKMRNGDYSEASLSRVLLENKEKIKSQVNDALEKSKNYNKIIVLTVSIEHAEFIHSLLPYSVIVHSKKKKNENKLAFDVFTNLNARILVSVLIASEGIDIPEADCLWFMRPTKSMRLYVQAAGRVLRKYPGKNHSLLLDYGNVIRNLGSIYDVGDYRPNETKIKKTFKICPKCDFFCDQDAKKCKECNSIFMVLCTECLREKAYGEKCPKGCTNSNDSFASMTTTAYCESPIKGCKHIMIAKGTGKSGPYLKITYFQEANHIKSYCSEYLSFSQKWIFKKFFDNTNLKSKQLVFEDEKEIEDYILENYIPTLIKRKNDKYGYKRVY